MPQKLQKKDNKNLYIIAILFLIGIILLQSHILSPIKTAPTISNNVADTNSLPIKPEKWLTYSNNQYRYSLTYPDKWDIIEAVSMAYPTSNDSSRILLNGELQKVTFFYTGPLPQTFDDIGEFQLTVYANKEGYSLDQWINNFKQSQQYSLVIIAGNTQVNGIDAKNISISHFAENYTALVFSKGEYIYIMKFGVNSTNGRNNSKADLVYSEIYNKMANSFMPL